MTVSPSLIVAVSAVTVLLFLLVVTVFSAEAQDANSTPPAKAVAPPANDDNIDGESLRQAARDGKLENVKSALSAGVDVDATTEYGTTALFFACDRGHQDIVDFLLNNGANPNAKDTFYKATPMTWAQSKGQVT